MPWGWERGFFEGSGGRSICPPGRKVVPSDTEGRYRPEASASASDPRLDRRGREVSQEVLGRALRGSPGLNVRDRGGLGPSGSAPPPRLARLLRLRQLVVSVCWCPFSMFACA